LRSLTSRLCNKSFSFIPPLDGRDFFIPPRGRHVAAKLRSLTSRLCNKPFSFILPLTGEIFLYRPAAGACSEEFTAFFVHFSCLFSFLRLFLLSLLFSSFPFCSFPLFPLFRFFPCSSFFPLFCFPFPSFRSFFSALPTFPALLFAYIRLFCRCSKNGRKLPDKEQRRFFECVYRLHI